MGPSASTCSWYRMMASRGLPERVRVIEVGPRDGFQMEERFVPTEFKAKTVEGLVSSGLAEIEATSFVHPRVIPQMADAAELMGRIKDRWDVRLSVLVPNLKGAQRALEVGGVDELRVVVASTESYNQRNVGLSIDESADRFASIAETAQRHGVDTTVVFGVALGCPIEGDVPIERVVELTERFVGLGGRRLSPPCRVSRHPTRIRRATVPGPGPIVTPSPPIWDGTCLSSALSCRRTPSARIIWPRGWHSRLVQVGPACSCRCMACWGCWLDCKIRHCDGGTGARARDDRERHLCRPGQRREEPGRAGERRCDQAAGHCRHGAGSW